MAVHQIFSKFGTSPDLPAIVFANRTSPFVKFLMQKKKKNNVILNKIYYKIYQ